MTHSLRLFPFALACAVAVGCKARNFNEAEVATFRSETGSSAGLPVPVGVDPKLLTNLAPPEDDPRANLTADTIIRLPKGGAFATLRGTDGKPLGEVSDADAIVGQKWNVLDYEKILKKAHGADASVNAPAPFAAKSVLSALRKIRKEFARRIEGGADNVPNLLGERAMLEAMPKLMPYSVYEMKDPARPFATTACGNYDPRDYGDVKWHYYCQIPGIFRGCQRLIVGRLYERKSPAITGDFDGNKLSSQQYAEALVRLRREDEESVRSYCLNPAGFADKETKAVYDKMVTNYEQNWKLPAGSLPRIFQKFYSSQKDEATGVNMYDYIMRSGIYAWDFEQQQAVLNTFYGALKPKREGTFNPSDPRDCNAYREPRTKSEALLGQNGTHCLASGTRDLPFYVAPVGAR